MKKVAFVVVLVAAIVGMVFGGLSVASAGFFDPTPHPTSTPRPTPTPDCCQNVNDKVTSIQGNVSGLRDSLFGIYDSINYTLNDILNEFPNLIKMGTMVGNFTTDNTMSGTGDTDIYSHWSITLWANGVDSGDWIYVDTKLPTERRIAELTSSNYTNNTAVNFELDGRGWEIVVNDTSGDPVFVYFCVTQMYPGY